MRLASLVVTSLLLIPVAFLSQDVNSEVLAFVKEKVKGIMFKPPAGDTHYRKVRSETTPIEATRIAANRLFRSRAGEPCSCCRVSLGASTSRRRSEPAQVPIT